MRFPCTDLTLEGEEDWIIMAVFVVCIWPFELKRCNIVFTAQYQDLRLGICPRYILT